MASLFMIAGAVLLGAMALVLLLMRRKQETRQANARFMEALGHSGQGLIPETLTRILRAPGSNSFLGKLGGADSTELDTMLRRAGWISQQQRALYRFITLLAPFGLLLIGMAGAGIVGKSGVQVYVAGFVGFALGYVAPRRFAEWRAGARQRAIQDEMTTVLYLFRMLFDAGASLEHSLAIMVKQGDVLLPNMAAEFALVLGRINSGQDRALALEEMSSVLDVPELSDTIAIIKQVTKYGGNLRDSLASYAKLMEDRRMTDLREKVSKLSAKMTIVMVVFMFPALMIFLAGPGLLALGKALSNV
jgi:tight adherence protein C